LNSGASWGSTRNGDADVSDTTESSVKYFDDSFFRRYFSIGPTTFERLLRNPERAKDVVKVFIKSLRVLKEQKGISFLCFLDVEGHQPSGALSIMTTLGEGVSLHTSVWSRKTHDIIKGYRPRPSERGAIIYDICLSGKTLTSVATELRYQYQVLPEAAVVFRNEGSRRELRIAPEGIVFPIIDVASIRETPPTGCASSSQEPSEESLGESSSLVRTDSIVPVKEVTMTGDKTIPFRLIAVAFSPLAIYLVLVLLALGGIISRETVNEVRKFVTILAK
jgi:hypothetical protein